MFLRGMGKYAGTRPVGAGRRGTKVRPTPLHPTDQPSGGRCGTTFSCCSRVSLTKFNMA